MKCISKGGIFQYKHFSDGLGTIFLFIVFNYVSVKTVKISTTVSQLIKFQ